MDSSVNTTQDTRSAAEQLDDFVRFLTGDKALPADRALALCQAMNTSPKVTDMFAHQMGKSMDEQAFVTRQLSRALSSDERAPQLLMAVIERPENADIKKLMIDMTRTTNRIITTLEQRPDQIDSFGGLISEQQTGLGQYEFRVDPQKAKALICSPDIAEPMMEMAGNTGFTPERVQRFAKSFQAEIEELGEYGFDFDKSMGHIKGRVDKMEASVNEATSASAPIASKTPQPREFAPTGP